MKGIYFIVFFCSSFVAIAQNDLKFENYSTDNGLPASYVRTINMDNKGFIWIGMQGGCYRFDGYNFKTFPVEDSSGVRTIRAWVNDILVDSKNRLWVGEVGQYGLLGFDYDKEKFINYFKELNLPDNAKRISVTSLMYDSKGWLWIGTSGSKIIKFNPDKKVTKVFNGKKGKDRIIPFGECHSIVEGGDDNIWIGTEIGLFRYNTDLDNFSYFKNLTSDPENKSEYILTVFKDSNNDIWIGAYSGIYKYESESNTFTRFLNSKNEQGNTITRVGSIYEDTQKRLWIGNNNGLCITNKSKTTFRKINYYEGNTEGIISNMIKCIFQDNTGNMWIGTAEGISRLKDQKFKSYKYFADKKSISQNKVQSIAEGPDNKIWISTPKGIDIFDRGKDEFLFFSSWLNNQHDDILRAPTVFLHEPGRGMWIGTFKGGLNFYDSKAKRFSNYLKDLENPNSISGNFITSLQFDNRGNLFIGTTDGLNYYDQKKNIFTRYNHESDIDSSLPSNSITSLYYDSKKQLWIGANDGVALWNGINKYSFQRILSAQDYKIREELRVSCFHESNNSIYIWIATNQGLFRYSFSTKKILRYSTQNGLPDLNIYSILEDSNDNLWIGTSKGLVKIYSVSEKDTALSCNTYDKSDGLQGNGFLPASSCRANDGTMLFGGNRGFSMFHPDSIFENSYPPKLVLTELEISNAPVLIGEKRNGQLILEKSISNTHSIVLENQNNNFAIKFSALHYSQPEKNKYAYMLKGFDNDWQYTWANNRKAHYMNLEKGEYTFYVKASNCDGVWTKKPISLSIVILPAFWETTWFKFVLVLILLATVFLFIKVRTHNLSRQNIKLEQTVKNRTEELLQMNEILEERKVELESQMQHIIKMNRKMESLANQLHEADESKLRFFANISHEFRTPLSLIIGALDKCLHVKKPIVWEQLNISSYHKLMQKNAQRLLHLVNQIIDFRKIDQGIKTLHISNNNIIDFIREIVNVFSIQADAKGIQLRVKSEELRVKSKEFEVDSEEISDTEQLFTHHSSLITQFWFDPDIMEKIMYNLISNAIKYTPEGGAILIAIDVTVETRHALSLPNNKLAIKISDTGIGMKPENLNKIFDRFYRVKTHGRASLQNNRASQPEGTGIGLAYTKELVELHKGAISVESEPGKGTLFTLEFPFLNENSDKKSNDKDISPVKLDYIHSMLETTEGALDLEGPEVEMKNSNTQKGSTVLIVEDNKDLRQFITSELRNNFQVIEAEDGQAALDIASEKNLDLIISDIMMPGMDGLEFCRHIKSNENTNHIPVVLLTAKSDEKDIVKGIETGADDYITKPFKLPVLLAKINRIIESRQQLREKFLNFPIEIKKDIADLKSPEEKFLTKATEIVINNLSDQNFNNTQFIEMMGMSKSVIYRKLNSITGKSLSEFIRIIRLKTAAKLLIEGSKNISEVADSVGFKHRENFTTYFTAFFGQNPSEYIKKNPSQ